MYGPPPRRSRRRDRSQPAQPFRHTYVTTLPEWSRSRSQPFTRRPRHLRMRATEGLRRPGLPVRPRGLKRGRGHERLQAQPTAPDERRECARPAQTSRSHHPRERIRRDSPRATSCSSAPVPNRFPHASSRQSSGTRAHTGTIHPRRVTRNLAASTVVRCTYPLRRVHWRHLEEGHMMLAIASILLSALTAAPADVTGKWEGRLTATRSCASTHEDTVLLILNQKDGTITGTIGGSENDQHAITTGTIDGDKVRSEERG